MTSYAASRQSLSLKQILAPVSDDLARIDDTLRATLTLELPLVRTAVEAMIAAGGKRLRPAVLFLAASFNDYDVERLLPMATAIELLHTASLVHDDTIDNALVRRGLPTLNSMIDEGTTVLVGDYLFAKSAVLSTEGGISRATRIFAESLVTICEGEIEQKFSLHRVTNSVENYYRRIYSKTAVLFAAAGELGGLLSNAPEEQIALLRNYGRQVGMAFQIVDDILDLRASVDELGKPTGGDLRQGTLTLPTMLYMEQADEAGRSIVEQVLSGAREDALVEEAIARINSSDAPDRAYSHAVQFADEAKQALVPFADAQAKRSLIDLADFAVQRRF